MKISRCGFNTKTRRKKGKGNIIFWCEFKWNTIVFNFELIYHAFLTFDLFMLWNWMHWHESEKEIMENKETKWPKSKETQFSKTIIIQVEITWKTLIEKVQDNLLHKLLENYSTRNFCEYVNKLVITKFNTKPNIRDRS